MPKRHVILIAKIPGDKAELCSSTMQALGLADGDHITITAPTSVYILPVVAGPVGPSQIKLPTKASVVLKEGERIAVEPAEEPLFQPPAPRPVAKKASGLAKMEWDSIGPSDFNEIVGLGVVKSRIEQALFYLTHPDWFLIRKSLPPRVFLFFGPYGCGKTMLAKAMSGVLASSSQDGCPLDVKLKVIRSTDIKDPYLGMSARRVQEYLSAAREASNQGSTVLLLLDEIDSLVGNRADKQTHEEYRDVVNTLIQEIQGVHELETESRIRALWKDPEVVDLRNHLAMQVRKKGLRDHEGDLLLPQERWSRDVKEKMLALRKRVMDEGGVSTVIMVGTTNDPCRVDEAFVSRAGDNIFFVPRPSPEAIEAMLEHHLDSDFVELTRKERRELAHNAFKDNLTGRDIVLSWLQPLRNRAPGALTIVGYKTVKSHQPAPTVGIEWEIALYQRLKSKGHLFLAEQVAEYLAEVQAARKPSNGAARVPAKAKSSNKRDPKRQPALFDM